MIYLRKRLFRSAQEKRMMKLFPKLELEPNVIIKGDLKNLNIHGDVLIQSFTVIHLGGMDWCQGKGHLSINTGTCISPSCTIYGAGPEGIYIGKNFDCGPGVRIMSSYTDYESLNKKKHHFKKVVIEDDVIVYSNAVISAGVLVGSNSVIAAGSVVLKDVPSGVMVGGQPAKLLKQLNHK